MRNNRAKLILLIGLTFLAGCGINAVRVKSASEVAALSTALSGSAKAQLENASALRQKAFLSLIASDPSCEFGYPIFIFIPNKAGASGAPTCARDPNERRAGYRTQAFDFSPIAAEALAPTLDLIGAVSAYGEALAKIVEQPDIDISDDIAEAIGLASRAQALAAGLGASALPDIAAITDDQQKTAADLINFLANLAKEKRQVKAIREIVAKQAPHFRDSCSSLQRQIANWNNIVGKQSTVINRNSLQRYYRAERRAMNFELRERMLTLILNADQEKGRIERANKAFGSAVQELLGAQADLEAALDNPTADQRAEAAKISRARFVNAFKLAIDTLLAWKVI